MQTPPLLILLVWSVRTKLYPSISSKLLRVVKSRYVSDKHMKLCFSVELYAFKFEKSCAVKEWTSKIELFIKIVNGCSTAFWMSLRKQRFTHANSVKVLIVYPGWIDRVVFWVDFAVSLSGKQEVFYQCRKVFCFEKCNEKKEIIGLIFM